MPQARSLKFTVGGIAGCVTIISFLLPHLALRDRVENNTQEIKTLKLKYDVDHETLTVVSVDIKYMKQDISTIRIKLEEISQLLKQQKIAEFKPGVYPTYGFEPQFSNLPFILTEDIGFPKL